jgi:microcin C transport system permease protein
MTDTKVTAKTADTTPTSVPGVLAPILNPLLKWWAGLPPLSPLMVRRLQNFRGNKRGFWSLWIFLVLFGTSLFAEFIANDQPVMVAHRGSVYFPVVKTYLETDFGGEFDTRANYRDPYLMQLFEQEGAWVWWAPVRYNYSTILKELPRPAPSPPSWTLSSKERCNAYPRGVDDPSCTVWNWNWLGTDDEGRDLFARILYGFRLSVTFGLMLTFFASIVGIVAGAIQGYFGGLTDLLFQRFIEVWTSMPSLYILLIMSAVFTQSFWTILGILILFSWPALQGLVRAEFLRGRNFEYVRAARALGLSDSQIMIKHIFPNAMVATVTMLPFITAGSIGSLTALDYLGLGLPVGSPSLGELLQQGRDNITAPWLGFTAFFVTATMLSLLVFIGEAVRDALDPRKSALG